MSSKKKDLIREYKQNERPMGIYQVRNIANGKVLIGASVDLPGIFNRARFQLSMGTHPNKSLQTEWSEYGADNFAFEILDQLSPRPDAGDPREELKALEDLWLEKVEPYAERGYNERKKGQDEKLRLIAEKRRITRS